MGVVGQRGAVRAFARQPWLKIGLGVSVLLGLYLLPSVGLPALGFVLFPLVVGLVSWQYVRANDGGFRLLARAMPSACYEGERLYIVLTLAWERSLPFVYATARDQFPPTGNLEGPEMMVTEAAVGFDRLVRLAYEIEVNRGHGDFVVGPLVVTLFDPLRLFAREQVIAAPAPLRVHLAPAATPVDLDLANVLTPMGDTASQRTGHSLEFFGIREFRSGDDPRSICWTKSAQCDRLIIREFELDSKASVVVVLNTDVKKIKGMGFGNSLKRAILPVAGIIDACRRRQREVRLVVPLADEPRVLEILPTPASVLFNLELLARLPGSTGVDFTTLLASAAAFIGPGTVVFAVSHTLDLDLEGVLEALLAMRARRARVALWAVDDTGMLRFSEQQPVPLTKDQLAERLGELGIEFALLPSVREGAGPPAPVEAGGARVAEGGRR